MYKSTNSSGRKAGNEPCISLKFKIELFFLTRKKNPRSLIPFSNLPRPKFMGLIKPSLTRDRKAKKGSSSLPQKAWNNRNICPSYDVPASPPRTQSGSARQSPPQRAARSSRQRPSETESRAQRRNQKLLLLACHHHHQRSGSWNSLFVLDLGTADVS